MLSISIKTIFSLQANCFIVSEAEESDDNLKNSSDGESTSLDELDSSFIDNDSQPEASQSVVDIHAKYLQSVRLVLLMFVLDALQ